jgi:MFS family permease
MSFIALLAVYSINFSFGVFFDYIINDMAASRATASFAFSLQSVFLFISAAIFGTVVDSFGVRPLVVSGAILLGLGMVGASVARTLPELLVTYGVLAGTGMGMIFIIGMTLPSRWFGQRRGTATAIATSGNGIAGLLAPPAAAVVIAAIGWQETYLVLTLAAVLVLVAVASLIGENPWSLGLDASHEYPNENPDTGPAADRDPDASTIRAVLNTRSFPVIVVSLILLYVPFYTLIVHFVAFVTDIGMERWVGVLAISLVGGMSIPGRLVFGTVADRIGRTRSFVGLSLCTGTLIITLSLSTSPVLLLGVTAIYGFIHGGAGTLVPTLIADFYGSALVTKLFGITSLAFAVSALAGPFIAGLTVETLGSYRPFLIASGVLVFVGAVGIHLAAILQPADSRFESMDKESDGR